MRITLYRRLFAVLVLLAATCVGASAVASDDGKASIIDLMERDDYILSSLIVVSPGKAIYSAGGHLAIRMRCPLQDVDYVYEYNATLDLNESLVGSYLNGDLQGEYIRSYTEGFIDGNIREGRIIEELPMNLTARQDVSLWAILDDAVDSGNNRHPFDPFFHNCCSMMLAHVGRTIGDEEFIGLSGRLCGPGRSFMPDFFAKSPWTGLCWNLMMGSAFDDDSKPLYLLYPKNLGDMLSYVRVGEAGATLIDLPDYATRPEWAAGFSFVSPLFVLGLLLLISVAVTVLNLSGRFVLAGRVLDVAMIVVNFAIGSVIWYMMLFSNPPVSSWNVLGLFFTPLSAVLLFNGDRIKGLRVVVSAYMALAGTVLLALLPVITQMRVFGTWMVVAAILARLYSSLWSSYITSKKKQILIHKTLSL